MFRRLITAIAILTMLVSVTATAALSARPSGSSPHSTTTSLDGRSPDTRDAAAAAHAGVPTLPTTVVFDGRSPDTKDAAASAHSGLAPVILANASGFDWVDALIGAAGGFGLAAVLGACVGLVRGRDRVIATS